MTEQLQLYIRAGHPLISIETADEPRGVELVRRVALEMKLPVCEWSITTGLMQTLPQPGPVLAPPGKVSAALQYLRDATLCAVYVFKDLGANAKDPFVQRQIRDAVQVCTEKRSTLVLVDPGPLPDSIRRFTTPCEVAPPSAEELEGVVRSTFRKISKESMYEVRSEITRKDMELLIQSLRGLSCSDASRIVSAAIHQDYVLSGDDLPLIVESKRRLLASTGSLESLVADFSTEDIGGLKSLKAWLRQRRGGFSQRARDFGLDPPRGVLMLGVQGCGKSLCAKVVAADWNMPLLRLDPGVLYQKFIGESESQLRQALRQAEAMAPVVLWIDEIEKAFASAGADSADGGLSQRMFGTLLSWMQDHRHPIFLVATANNLGALPPELMRKGRFDEIFFVDLPDAESRAGIFGIHLSRRKRDPEKFNLEALATAAEGFSGAEIEQAIVSGLYRAFSANEELSDEHLLAELEGTRPLSVVQAEKVDALREWARERCVPAD